MHHFDWIPLLASSSQVDAATIGGALKDEVSTWFAVVVSVAIVASNLLGIVLSTWIAKCYDLKRERAQHNKEVRLRCIESREQEAERHSHLAREAAAAIASALDGSSSLAVHAVVDQDKAGQPAGPEFWKAWEHIMACVLRAQACLTGSAAEQARAVISAMVGALAARPTVGADKTMNDRLNIASFRAALQNLLLEIGKGSIARHDQPRPFSRSRHINATEPNRTAGNKNSITKISHK